MERPSLTKVGMNRCEKLRWKGLFIEAAEDPSIQPNNERSFWCQHTWNCLGPDGKVKTAVIASSQVPDMDAATLNAVKKWSFKPGNRSIRPIPLLQRRSGQTA